MGTWPGVPLLAETTPHLAAACRGHAAFHEAALAVHLPVPVQVQSAPLPSAPNFTACTALTRVHSTGPQTPLKTLISRCGGIGDPPLGCLKELKERNGRMSWAAPPDPHVHTGTEWG